MRKTIIPLDGILIALAISLVHAICPGFCAGQGAVELEFTDKDTGDPVSARLTFTKSGKKLSRPRKVLFAQEQWLAEKKLQLTPPNGEFEFSAQRGPEFNEIKGGFTIEPRAKDSVPIAIPRSIDMHAEHWYSGDHLSALSSSDLSRWQAADAVDLTVSTAEAKETKVPNPNPPPKGRLSKGQDKATEESTKTANNPNGLGLQTSSRSLEWEHGAVLLHGVKSVQAKMQDGAEALELLDQPKDQKPFVVELLRPWSRDVPLLLASNAIRSVQILSSYNRMGGDDRMSVAATPEKGVFGKVQLTLGKEKSPSQIFAPIESIDSVRYKDALGVGKLSESIYWKMLEAGLQLTPTAGSGFVGNETLVGYNRVYAFSANPPDEAAWWQAISSGHTFVTNGPLLRTNINGLPPGSVQTSYRSQSIALDIGVSLAVRDPVDYLDVVFNGDTIYSAKLEDHYKRGEFPPIEIDKSGWLVIRVVTEHTKGYRLATTAPFYFVFDGKPRISREAVSFFQRWQKGAIESINSSPEAKTKYEPWVARSSQFWESKMAESNAE